MNGESGRRWLPYVIGCAALAVLLALWAAARREAVRFGFGPAPQGRVKVTYWEKWTGFEGDGMKEIVREFNQSQSRIWVDYVAVSSVDQKTLVATAGGRPPDVAGLWDANTAGFAEQQALTPLDEMMRAEGLKADHYIPVYWDMCRYAGKTWVLPSTPATTALHYNRTMFKEAGLDPNRPPRTFAELDAMSRKLTKVDPQTGRIVQMGFLPPEPGWWHFGWGSFFGGRLWDGDRRLEFDSPENIRAFTWVQGYARQYGTEALQTFRSTFGNFSSPQNPFMTGQVAIVLQGVWMANFVAMFAPKLDWAAAPFPTVKPGDDPVTFAGCDLLAIPRGAKHPREAFQFIAYVQRQGPMERLCLSHRKNSPLRRVSEEFYRRHRNPYIRMFQKLAWSKHAVHTPIISIWNEYGNEIYNAFDRVWLQDATPERALQEANARMQRIWDRALLTRAAAPSRTLKLAPFAVAGLILLGVLIAALLSELRIRREAGGSSPGRLLRMLGYGLAFASPWLVGLTIFVLYPVASSIILSFCDYSVLAEPRWVGLANFRDLAGDAVFWKSLWNTLRFAAFALPLGMGMSVAVAVLLDSPLRGRDGYRTAIFLPSITPLVASAMVWLWIFNAQFGVLNDALRRLSFGLIKPIPWLTDASWAMPALILMGFWGIGHTVVILLAGLQEVPVSLYEAADLDGATSWDKIVHVTLPMISPVIYFNLIMGIIGSLQVFAVPYIMTAGGPARSTLFYSMYLYDNAFRYLKMGYASAMAWILFLIILALTFAAVRGSKSRVHYTGG